MTVHRAIRYGNEANKCT